MSPVSCHMSHISCLTSPVSCLMSTVSTFEAKLFFSETTEAKHYFSETKQNLRSETKRNEAKLLICGFAKLKRNRFCFAKFRFEAKLFKKRYWDTLRVTQTGSCSFPLTVGTYFGSASVIMRIRIRVSIFLYLDPGPTGGGSPKNYKKI